MENITLPTPPIAIGELNFYVIVDCAHCDDDSLYYQLTTHTPVPAKSLFEGTLHESSAVAGPVLMKLHPEKNSHLIQQLQSYEADKPMVVWLWSQKNFDALSVDLTTLLFGELESGKKMLFRYFDPRVLEGMLDIFKDSEHAHKILTNIAAWAYKKDGQYHYLT